MAWSRTSLAGVPVSSMLASSPRRAVQSHSRDQPGTSVQCRMVTRATGPVTSRLRPVTRNPSSTKAGIGGWG